VRSLLLAALFLLVAPGVAGAAVTPGDYGGGAFHPPIKPRWTGHGSSLMWARVAPDGQVRLSGRVTIGCGTVLVDGQVTPAADGAFRFESRVDSRVERSRSRGTVVGRFDGTAASGTVRGRVRVTKDGRVRTCRTRGAATWELRMPGPPGAPALPQPGGTYRGITSQPGRHGPFPFLLRVADDGARVVQAKFEYERRCRRRGYTWTDLTPPATIAPDGTYRTRERFTVPSAGGVRETFRVRVDGRFTAGGVNGELRVTTKAKRRGRVFDRCNTGPVTFAASL
jgi:hypothetical protein